MRESIAKCVRHASVLALTSVLAASINAGMIERNVNFDYLADRVGVNLYVSGAKDFSQGSEFAALSYDISTSMRLIVGSSVSAPSAFHYLDLSMSNPWTFLSWQSSFELGLGRYCDEQTIKNRITQSISLDYPIDEFFSVQILLKRFATTLHKFSDSSNMLAMGVGMKI